MKIMIELDATPKPGGYYVDVDAIRLVIEGGKIVGWYAPNGLEEDPATMSVVSRKPYLNQPSRSIEGDFNG